MRRLCSWNCQIMLKNVLKCVTDLESVEQKVTFYGDFLADSSWLLVCMIGLIFAVHANGRSAMDRLIAVMNWLYWMSLDSVGCSLSLDSLTETWVTWLVAVVLLLQLAPSSSHIHVQADNHTHMSSSRSRYARVRAAAAAALILCPHCALCPIWRSPSGNVVIGRSIYGILVIHGSLYLYSRFYGMRLNIYLWDVES